MPDAGDFDLIPRNAKPGGPAAGWRAAFAALPQARPDPGGWERLAVRLPAPRPSRPRWQLPLAAAAVAGLAFAATLQLRPAAPAMDRGDAPVVLAAGPVQPTASVPAPAIAPAGDDTPPATMPVSSRSPASLPASPRPFRSRQAAAASSAPSPGDALDMEMLYARSAQLEALLAQARDPRVASAAAVLLGDALDARMARIDATLAQPGLDAGQLAELWSLRVETLQQLVGVEAGNRLHSIQGQGYQAALVTID